MIGKATASDWLIRTDEDHACALIRIDELMGAPEGSPEADELKLLAILVEDFETERFPVTPFPVTMTDEEREIEDRERDRINQVMADLLTRTANALKGPPAPLTQHSWHDLPEVAEELSRDWSRARQEIADWRALLPKLDLLRDLVGADEGEEPISRAIAEIERSRRST